VDTKTPEEKPYESTLGLAGRWQCTPLIPALKGRGGRISGFKVSLVYRVSYRTARVMQRNPVLKRGAGGGEEGKREGEGRGGEEGGGERENTEVTVHEMKERPREKLNMLRA